MSLAELDGAGGVSYWVWENFGSLVRGRRGDLHLQGSGRNPGGKTVGFDCVGVFIQAPCGQSWFSSHSTAWLAERQDALRRSGNAMEVVVAREDEGEGTAHAAAQT